ncbi:hypothetical protein [Lysobacter sp. CA199]|uniref:hypothetical protein n=1 Tax=Lysobacter sp. CA199 TaxID=3455608 RepID=UPI003F8D6B3C
MKRARDGVVLAAGSMEVSGAWDVRDVSRNQRGRCDQRSAGDARNGNNRRKSNTVVSAFAGTREAMRAGVAMTASIQAAKPAARARIGGKLRNRWLA